ncbi:M20/M25/M40 family metallo-hydrolase [Thalassorhabdomicrobium marinisediminis]|uniref:M20/M25/M40 family metallo-hydrolase n=1 Tax=Thalassorhabdomicrobium marinisediminis TaxID=2170577 RepID=UPI0031F005C6
MDPFDFDLHGFAQLRIKRAEGLIHQDNPAVQFAQRLLGTTATTKVAFGTEAGFFHGLGIPTIVCGPGSMAAQGHKADEFIEISQLEACNRMLAAAVKELCA